MKPQYVINFVLIVFIIFLVVGHVKSLGLISELEGSLQGGQISAQRVDIVNSQGSSVMTLSSDVNGNGVLTVRDGQLKKYVLLMTSEIGGFVIADTHGSVGEEGKVIPLGGGKVHIESETPSSEESSTN